MSSNRLQFFEISPGQKKLPKEEIAEPPPVLRLLPFVHAPKLSFGNVYLGSSKQITLYILNPKDQLQELYCEKYPTEDDGFQFSFLDTVVAPSETIALEITWAPSEQGGMRNVVNWRTSIGVRSQTVLLGNCVEKKTKGRKAKALGSKGKSGLRPSSLQPTVAKSGFKAPNTKRTVSNSQMSENIPPNSKQIMTKPSVQTSRKVSSVLREATNNVQVETKKTISKKKNKVDFSENISVRNYVEDSSMMFSMEDVIEKKCDQNYSQTNYTVQNVSLSKRVDNKSDFESYLLPEDRGVQFPPIPESTTPRRGTYLKSSSDLHRLHPGIEIQEYQNVTYVCSETKVGYLESNSCYQKNNNGFVSNSDCVVNEEHQDDIDVRFEEFGDAQKRIMRCDVPESPLRRQTYIKSRCLEDPEDINSITSSDPSTVYSNVQTQLKQEEDLTDPEISEILASQNRKNGVDINRTVHSEGSNIQYCSPAVSELNGGIAQSATKNQLQSCKELMKQWDSVFMSPAHRNNLEIPDAKQDDLEVSGCSFIPISSCGSDQFASSERCLEKSSFTEKWVEDAMYSAQSSPIQEFVTAPSTPTENDVTFTGNFLDNDCDKTQDFPTPNIDSDKYVKTANLSTPTFESLVLVKDTTISTDSLERSGMNECYSQIDFSSVNQNYEDDVDFKQLSGGTVVMENSLLHPYDLVNIDNSEMKTPIRKEIEILEDVDIVYPTTTPLLEPPSQEHQVNFDYKYIQSTTPVMSDFHDECNLQDTTKTEGNSFLLPHDLVSGHSFEMKSAMTEDALSDDLDLIHPTISSLEPSHSQVQNVNFEYNYVQSPMPLKSDLYTDCNSISTPKNLTNNFINAPFGYPNSEILNSLSDLSFIPHHPQHCSTLIKNNPAQEFPHVTKVKLFDNEVSFNVNSEFNGCQTISPDGNDVDIPNKDNAETIPAPETFHIEFDNKLQLEQSRESEKINDFDSLTGSAMQNHHFLKPDIPEPRISNSKTDKLFKKPAGTTFKISPPRVVHSTLSKNSRNVIQRENIKKSTTSSPKSVCKPKFACSSVKRRFSKSPQKSSIKAKSPIKQQLVTKKKIDSSLNLKKKSLHQSTLERTFKSRNISSTSSSSIKSARKPPKRKSSYISTSFQSSYSRLNPYAASNMYYDDRWMEKQISGFQKWLNFVLTPPDEENQSDSSKNVDITKLWMEANRCSSMQKAPSKEAISLKFYSARRRLSKLRRLACNLYQSPAIAQVVRNVEVAIGKKMMVIRKDRQTHADIGLKQEMLKLLLSYNPFWLRIGLETIYGEVLPMVSNVDVSGLTHFIVTRFLNCPVIGKRFAHPSVPYSYKQGYEEALKDFQLKKFLVLVYFLDKAKESRLIDNDPCLFKKNSEFKTTRDVLVCFAREFLSGVGDITKHLAYMGYTVSHKQTPLDEFDFSVSSLQTDLRCGVRITKVAEVLLQNYSLSKQLRLPAVSILQKVHNVGLALQAFEAAGIVHSGTESYTAKDIVNAHREKTLSLIWDIIFGLQIKNILTSSQLLNEISYLRRTLSVKSYNDTLAKEGFQKLKNSKEFNGFDQNDLPKSEFLIQLLKIWAQLVCAHYGLEIDNLTVSFCDGRAFCLILHHYHPDVLQLSDIQFETTFRANPMSHDLDSSLEKSALEESVFTDEDFSRRVSNDKANFNLLISKLHILGGVPILIKPLDMINTIPDEKVTTTFLAYLCARLLNLSAEIQAARVIQLAWRKKLSEIRRKRLEIEVTAASKIKSWWRKIYLRKLAIKYTKSVIIIQKYWRRVLAKRCVNRMREIREFERKNTAATIIQRGMRKYLHRQFTIRTKAAVTFQKTWKMILERRKFEKIKEATIVIQAAYRGYCKRREFWRMRESCLRIQYWWRCIRRARIQAQHMEFLNSNALKIQDAWRTYSTRAKFLRTIKAICVIQSNVRRWICRRNYLKEKNVITKLQQRYKANVMMKRERDSYLRMKAAALRIENIWIGHVIRSGFLDMKQCATVIQAAYRGHRDFSTFQKQKRAAVVIQSAFKSYSVRKELTIRHRSATIIQTAYRRHQYFCTFQKQRRAVVVIQSSFRGYLVKKDLALKHRSATIIQTAYRVHRDISSFQKQKGAAVVIQSAFRRHLVKKDLSLKHRCATIIQTAYRRHRDFIQFQNQRKAAILIQSAFRTYSVKKDLALRHKSATIIQATYRCHRDFSSFQKQRRAAVIIQSSFRGYSVKKDLALKHRSATLIQKVYRGRRELCAFQKQKRAAILIQSAFRSHSVRKEFTLRHRSATIIQTAYRCHRDLCTFQKQRIAAVVIQSAFRSYSVRKELTHKHRSATVIQSAYRCHRNFINFQKQRKAAILIQSAFRTYSVKKELALRRKSATIIQATYRGHRDFSTFQKQRRAAVVIQSSFRGYLVKKDLALKHRSAAIIQTAYRGYRDLSSFKKQKRAAVVLQSVSRGYLVRKELSVQHRCATIIQTVYRGHRDFCTFQKQKRAAILIQATFRSHSVRKDLALRHRSATIIQTAYRSHRDFCAFHKQRSAAIVIQSVFRTYSMKKELALRHKSATIIQAAYRGHRDFSTFEKQRRAVVIIQSSFRGYLVKKDLAIKHGSATTIQTAYRRHRDLCAFQKQRRAAIVIQSTLRGYLVKKDLALKHRSAIIIQTSYRGHRDLSSFQKQKRAAVVIQSAFRGYLVKKDYSLKHRCAIIIQSAYRSHRDFCAFQKRRKAAILIQSSFRTYSVKKALDLKHRSATIIQTCYRKHRDCCAFQKQRRAALVIQSAFRRYLVKKDLSLKHRSAIIIQTAYRRYRDFSSFQKQRTAAILIQSAFRTYSVKRDLALKHRSATIIQTFYRSHRDFCAFQKQRRAVIVIQSALRGYLVKKDLALKHRCATIIQTAYRGHHDISSFQKQKRAAVVIQSAFRGYLVKKDHSLNHRCATIIQSAYRSHRDFCAFQKQRKAAILIQSAFRRYSVKRDLALKHRSATIIQAVYRRHRDFCTFQKQRRAAVVIQSVFRRYLVQRALALKHRNATIIQKAYRGHRDMSSFQKQKKAAVVIQSAFRSYLVNKDIALKNRCATIIQAAYRGHHDFSSFQKQRKSAIIIQSAVRMYQERTRYITHRNAVVVLQNYFRSYLLSQRCKEEYMMIKRTVVLLQARVRGNTVRKVLRSKNDAVITIQAHCRRWLVERDFRRKRTDVLIIQKHWRATIQMKKEQLTYRVIRGAAITLQSYWRGQNVRKHLEYQNNSAEMIQTFWRNHKTRQQYIRKKKAIVIQRWWRSIMEMNLKRYHYLYLQGCIILIQARVRGILARRRYQTALTNNLTKHEREDQASIRIQRWFRFVSDRKKFLRKRNASLVIQRQWRASVQMLRAKEYYIYLKRATIILQTAWRMRRTRRHSKELNAAIKIQKAAKKELSTKVRPVAESSHPAETQQKAAVVVQRYWRGYQTRKRLLFDRRITQIRGRLLIANDQAHEGNKISVKSDEAIRVLVNEKHLKPKLCAVITLDNCTRLSSYSCDRLCACSGLEALMILLRDLNRSVPAMEIILYILNILITLSKYPPTRSEMTEIPDLINVIIEKMKISYEKNIPIFLKCSTLLYILASTGSSINVFSSARVKSDLASLENLMTRKAKFASSKSTSRGRPVASPQPSLNIDWQMTWKEVREFSDPLFALKALKKTVDLKKMTKKQ